MATETGRIYLVQSRSIVRRCAKAWENEVQPGSRWCRAEIVGMPQGGYQVACAPSEGKTISMARRRSIFPQSVRKNLHLFKPQPESQSRKSPSRRKRKMIWRGSRMQSNAGYLDTEVEDYDRWLSVGMALHDRSGDTGVQLGNRGHIDPKNTSPTNAMFRSRSREKRSNGPLRLTDRHRPAERRPAERPAEADAATTGPNKSRFRRDRSGQRQHDSGSQKERAWVWGDPDKNVG